MKLKFIYFFILTLCTVNAYADCTAADMSLQGFVPSVVDFTSASTITVDFQTSHAPFTGAARCYYFGYLDYGGAASWTTRYMTNTTTGTTIPFNVYSRPSTINNSRVRIPSDANANRHVIYQAPRFFNPSASTVTNTNSFYAKLGTLPAVLEPGIYTEALVFRVAARLSSPPAGDWPVWPIPLSRAIQFMYQVEKELSLSIVASGGVFDPLSTAKLMSFGELETGEVRSADIIVQTNVGYRLKASSVNDGELKHSSGAGIDYSLRVLGANVSLVGSSTSPVQVSASSSNSPALGFIVPLEVEIGAVTGNEPGGDYSDVLSISIEAF